MKGISLANFTPEQRRERLRVQAHEAHLRRKERNRLLREAFPLIGPVFPAPTPPEEVLAERDRVFSAPCTIGQMLLGEPMPGRSALDRMSV